MQVDTAERIESLNKEVSKLLQGRDLRFFGALPFSEVLSSTRMDEVQAALKARLQQEHRRTDVTVAKVGPVWIQRSTTLLVSHQNLHP